MVERKLSGQSTSAIARAEGLDRGWAGKELASDECRQIILDLVRSQEARIGRMFSKTLDVIEEAYKAKSIVHFQGSRLTLGPDHYARLTASKRFLDVVSLGRPTAKAAEGAGNEGGITLAELKRRIEESKRPVLQ